MTAFTRHLLFAGLAFGLAACSSDENNPAPQLQNETESYAAVEAESTTLQDIGEGVALGGSALASKTDMRFGACANVKSWQFFERNDTLFRQILLGFNGSTCADGRTRSGSILIRFAWTNSTDTLMAAREIRTVGYTVDGVEVRANIRITYDGGNLTKTVVARDTLIYPDETFVTWNSTRQWQWTAGSTTPFIVSDDEFTLQGIGGGLARNGNEYVAVIDEADPLVFKVGCGAPAGPQFVSGKITLATEGVGAGVIDYGDGACDGQATLTIGPNSRVIALR